MYWFGLAFFLLIMELFSGTLYMLFIAIAFVVVGLCEVVLKTGMNFNLALASVLIIVCVFTVKKLNYKRKSKRSDVSDDFDMGQIVEVVSYQADGSARIFYRGVEWEARLASLPEITSEKELKKAKIVAKEGNTLVIECV